MTRYPVSACSHAVCWLHKLLLLPIGATYTHEVRRRVKTRSAGLHQPTSSVAMW
jgi:hypothetical protein